MLSDGQKLLEGLHQLVLDPLLGVLLLTCPTTCLAPPTPHIGTTLILLVIDSSCLFLRDSRRTLLGKPSDSRMPCKAKTLCTLTFAFALAQLQFCINLGIRNGDWS